MSEWFLYCANCADVETPISACFIEYGRSLCSPCFFKLKEIDEGVRRAMGDPDSVQTKQK